MFPSSEADDEIHTAGGESRGQQLLSPYYLKLLFWTDGGACWRQLHITPTKVLGLLQTVAFISTTGLPSLYVKNFKYDIKKTHKHLKVSDLTTPSSDNVEAADLAALSELWLLRLYLDNSSGIRHLNCK